MDFSRLADLLKNTETFDCINYHEFKSAFKTFADLLPTNEIEEPSEADFHNYANFLIDYLRLSNEKLEHRKSSTSVDLLRELAFLAGDMEVSAGEYENAARLYCVSLSMLNSKSANSETPEYQRLSIIEALLFSNELRIAEVMSQRVKVNRHGIQSEDKLNLIRTVETTGDILFLTIQQVMSYSDNENLVDVNTGTIEIGKRCYIHAKILADACKCCYKTTTSINFFLNSGSTDASEIAKRLERKITYLDNMHKKDIDEAIIKNTANVVINDKIFSQYFSIISKYHDMLKYIRSGIAATSIYTFFVLFSIFLISIGSFITPQNLNESDNSGGVTVLLSSSLPFMSIDERNKEIDILSNRFSMLITTIIQDIIEYALVGLVDMQNKPVEFVLFAIGSLARNEACPYSDFEYGILCNAPRRKELSGTASITIEYQYLRLLQTILSIRFIALLEENNVFFNNFNENSHGKTNCTNVDNCTCVISDYNNCNEQCSKTFAKGGNILGVTADGVVGLRLDRMLYPLKTKELFGTVEELVELVTSKPGMGGVTSMIRTSLMDMRMMYHYPLTYIKLKQHQSVGNCGINFQEILEMSHYELLNMGNRVDSATPAVDNNASNVELGQALLGNINTAIISDKQSLYMLYQNQLYNKLKQTMSIRSDDEEHQDGSIKTLGESIAVSGLELKTFKKSIDTMISVLVNRVVDNAGNDNTTQLNGTINIKTDFLEFPIQFIRRLAVFHGILHVHNTFERITTLYEKHIVSRQWVDVLMEWLSLGFKLRTLAHLHYHTECDKMVMHATATKNASKHVFVLPDKYAMNFKLIVQYVIPAFYEMIYQTFIAKRQYRCFTEAILEDDGMLRSKSISTKHLVQYWFDRSEYYFNQIVSIVNEDKTIVKLSAREYWLNIQKQWYEKRKGCFKDVDERVRQLTQYGNWCFDSATQTSIPMTQHVFLEWLNNEVFDTYTTVENKNQITCNKLKTKYESLYNKENKASYGKNLVINLNNTIHLKLFPEFPGNEYAVSQLVYSTVGYVVPLNILRRIHLTIIKRDNNVITSTNESRITPVLVSKSVLGCNLQELLSYDSKILSIIEEENYSANFIKSLLINPGDDRAVNFVVYESKKPPLASKVACNMPFASPNAVYCNNGTNTAFDAINKVTSNLICVDNDHCFCFMFEKDDAAGRRLAIQSVIYADDRTYNIDEVVHPNIIKKLSRVDKDPYAIVKNWLNELVEIEDVYRKMFGNDKSQLVYKNIQDVTLSVDKKAMQDDRHINVPVFNMNLVKELYFKLNSLMQALKNTELKIAINDDMDASTEIPYRNSLNHCKITLKSIFERVQKSVCKAYRREIGKFMENQSVKDRYHPGKRIEQICMGRYEIEVRNIDKVDDATSNNQNYIADNNNTSVANDLQTTSKSSNSHFNSSIGPQLSDPVIIRGEFSPKKMLELIKSLGTSQNNILENVRNDIVVSKSTRSYFEKLKAPTVDDDELEEDCLRQQVISGVLLEDGTMQGAIDFSCLDKDIQTFILDKVLGCSTTGIRDFAVKSIQFYYLSLRGCSELTDEKLIAIVEKCCAKQDASNLKYLDVRNCNQLTERSYEFILDMMSFGKLSNLKTVYHPMQVQKAKEMLLLSGIDMLEGNPYVMNDYFTTDIIKLIRCEDIETRNMALLLMGKLVEDGQIKLIHHLRLFWCNVTYTALTFTRDPYNKITSVSSVGGNENILAESSTSNGVNNQTLSGTANPKAAYTVPAKIASNSSTVASKSLVDTSLRELVTNALTIIGSLAVNFRAPKTMHVLKCLLEGLRHHDTEMKKLVSSALCIWLRDILTGISILPSPNFNSLNLAASPLKKSSSLRYRNQNILEPETESENILQQINYINLIELCYRIVEYSKDNDYVALIAILVVLKLSHRSNNNRNSSICIKLPVKAQFIYHLVNIIRSSKVEETISLCISSMNMVLMQQSDINYGNDATSVINSNVSSMGNDENRNKFCKTITDSYSDLTTSLPEILRIGIASSNKRIALDSLVLLYQCIDQQLLLTEDITGSNSNDGEPVWIQSARTFAISVLKDDTMVQWVNSLNQTNNTKSNNNNSNGNVGSGNSTNANITSNTNQTVELLNDIIGKQPQIHIYKQFSLQLINWFILKGNISNDQLSSVYGIIQEVIHHNSGNNASTHAVADDGLQMIAIIIVLNLYELQKLKDNNSLSDVMKVIMIVLLQSDRFDGVLSKALHTFIKILSDSDYSLDTATVCTLTKYFATKFNSTSSSCSNGTIRYYCVLGLHCLFVQGYLPLSYQNAINVNYDTVTASDFVRLDDIVAAVMSVCDYAVVDISDNHKSKETDKIEQLDYSMLIDDDNIHIECINIATSILCMVIERPSIEIMNSTLCYGKLSPNNCYNTVLQWIKTATELPLAQITDCFNGTIAYLRNSASAVSNSAELNQLTTIMYNLSSAIIYVLNQLDLHRCKELTEFNKIYQNALKSVETHCQKGNSYTDGSSYGINSSSDVDDPTVVVLPPTPPKHTTTSFGGIEGDTNISNNDYDNNIVAQELLNELYSINEYLLPLPHQLSKLSISELFRLLYDYAMLKSSDEDVSKTKSFVIVAMSRLLMLRFECKQANASNGDSTGVGALDLAKVKAFLQQESSMTLIRGYEALQVESYTIDGSNGDGDGNATLGEQILLWLREAQ